MLKFINIYKLFFSTLLLTFTLIGCGGGGVSGGESSTSKPDPYTVSVQENQTSAVTATVSHSSPLTYSLALGVTDNDAFNIDSSTGVVIFKGFPDYETKKQYKVTVNATDGSAFNSNIVYTINITDVNDPNTFNATENLTSAITATVSHANVLTYSLAAGITDNDNFNIDSTTAVVTFKVAPDFEIKNQYKITVNSTDGLTFNTDTIYTINITDVDDPKIFSVAENQTNAITASINSTSILTYSLAAGITDNDDFNINATTAVVTFKVAPDYETKTQYKITVHATDGLTYNSDIVYTINITDLDDTAPIFSGSFSSSVLEEQTSAFTATATDSNTITYSLSAGVTDNNDFSINSTSGVVTFNTAPDYEIKTSYSITVTATDSLSNVSTQVYTLSITNVDDDAPVFTGSFTATVAENQTTATTANTTDLNTVTYSLGSGVTDNDDFNINSSSGVITFKVAPNFEIKASYSITVIATDSLAYSSTQVYTITISDVDENAPVFNAPYIISGDENQTSVSAISVTDASIITYSLTSGVTENNSFSINSSTGAITFNSAPNYEVLPTKTSYTITITATDSLSNTSSQAYTVNVNDIDENPPVFTGSFTPSAAENQKTAFTASATDASTITYSLDSGVNDNDTFTIDSSSGAVTFKLYPDYEAVPIKRTFTVTVRATDTQSNIKTQDYTLALTDVDETLTFNSLPYEFIRSQATGRYWLDRNIGATQVCTSSSDSSCYGDYYQFGRLRDGHELVTVSPPHSSIVNTKATNIINTGTSNFIYSASPVDWISDQTNIDDGTLRKISWSQTNGDDSSNKLVCPSGYRIPTNSELKAETINNGVIDSASAFSNFLKLPVSGFRNGSDGVKGDVGTKGYLWSLDVSGGKGNAIEFDSSSIGETTEAYFANAYPIRCIKDIDTNTSTEIDAGADQTVYEGDTVTLTATAGFTSYEWKEGGVGTISLGSSVSLVKNNFTAGTHYLTVIGTDSNGKESIDTVSITVKSTSITHNTIPYIIITSPYTGKKWLDRNIGASDVCSSVNDSDCYGDYFQWGRLADGHEKLGSSPEPTQSATITPGHDRYISTNDWTTATNADSLRKVRWALSDGTSVCPDGFRVPTSTEIDNEANIAAGNWSNANDTMSSLKIPISGVINSLNNNTLSTIGAIWINEEKSATHAYYYRVESSLAERKEISKFFRAPIRCIEN